MNFIIFLIVGGLAGWIASKIMGTDAQQGIILNVVVGIVGAILAGWVISPLIGVGDITDGFSIGAFLVSIAGACLLLFLVKLVRKAA
ncbi:GlsB/YeaQ/YmgE family stress response membrane protein [Rubrivirga sp. IMCC43871]|uniref:GlsB/YeaQ/YmgE family stress response membrane protein n=1 Tax=Rubrivirga sp. IMCC43871 TaxID=3391575 RepID=UPI00398FC288